MTLLDVIDLNEIPTVSSEKINVKLKKKNENYWMCCNLIICTIIVSIIIIIIFLLPNNFTLGSKATEPTIFQHFKAKFDQHTFS